MSSRRILGHSSKTKNGVLIVKTPYIRIPYCLLRSDDFLLLSPLAVKIYFIMLRQWKSHFPDEPVQISVDKLRELVPTFRKGKRRKAGRNQITRATKELWKMGFIHKVEQYRKCNLYYMEQKRLTGEWV